VPRPSGARQPRRRPRHLPHGDHVRRHRQGVRHRLLPLVLPHPAVRPPGAADRRRARLFPRPDARRLEPDPDVFTDEALAEYRRCFRKPETIHATCEDYRAAARIDLEHDAADAEKRIGCPLLVLWGAKGIVGRRFDPLAAWREKAGDVRGKAIECGHFIPEERPEETLDALRAFLEI
jgi:pimeloyl-ACP methyl ester carboxylesterase